MKNINSLIIGSTSQLSYYFPKEYERISSKFIREKLPLPLKSDFYDRIFVCFAEQRTFLENKEPDLFYQTNIHDTIQLISFLSSKCNKLIVYGTAELWNNYEGAIDISMPFNFNSTVYIRSKEGLHLMIKDMQLIDQFKNVIILHPVNFNSIYRKEGFLFTKIFQSIVHKQKIEIGDTYFYRDLVHPKYVVERSINAEKDEIVGSGRLIFVNDFIRNLYCHFRMNYTEYVTETDTHNVNIKRKIYYANSKECLYSYDDLFFDTITDLEYARLQNKTSK